MNDFGSPPRKSSRSRSMPLRIVLGVGFVAGLSSLGALAGNLAKGSGSIDGVTLSMTGTGLHHEWRLRHGKHWQIVSSPSESQEATDAAEGTRGTCGQGMVEVKGRMKMDPSS